MTSALIVGCSGQDGSYLYDLLAVQGYTLWGIDRGTARGSKDCQWVRPVDISDAGEVRRAISDYQPDQVYHLAAYHHSAQNAEGESAELLEQSYRIHTLSLDHFLEAIRHASPRTRLFYAASCHIFGSPLVTPQDEATPINPHSAYAITKAAGVFLCRTYRSQYGVYAAAGILYNHESPRRGPEFVSKKIVQAAVRIQRGQQERLALGDLGAEVDWGYAPDYVNAMSRILRLPAADDFVIATGIPHSVQEFAEIAFSSLGLDWSRYVVEEAGILKRSTPRLVGNPRKLLEATGWKPAVSFQQMVEIMVHPVERDG